MVGPRGIVLARPPRQRGISGISFALRYREISRCRIRPVGGRGASPVIFSTGEFPRRERTTEAANYACRFELSRRFLSSFCHSPSHGFLSPRVETTRGIGALPSPGRRKLWNHDGSANANAFVSSLLLLLPPLLEALSETASDAVIHVMINLLTN
jgi:hypothetical protein